MAFTRSTVQLAKYLIFITVRFGFTRIQQIYWRISGTRKGIEGSILEQNFMRSAQLLDIIWKEKFLDTYVAEENNFLCFHSAFVNPWTILDNDVTIYSVTKTHVIFVKTPGVDVYNSKVNPFFYIAQFVHAKQMLKIPHGVFEKVAEELGDPKVPVTWVGSTGRCGSTILNQIFEAVPGIVSIGEPDVLTAMMPLERTWPREKYERLVANIVRLICKPLKDVDVRMLCIKTRSWNFPNFGTIARKFPQLKYLFLYRDPEATMRSQSKAFGQYFWFMHFFHFLQIHPWICPPWNKVIVNLTWPTIPELAWAREDQFIRRLPLFCCYTVHTGGNYATYKHYCKQGINMRAITYEQLVHKPTESINALFEYCNLPSKYCNQALEAMKADSQENSPLSQSKLKSRSREVIPQDHLQQASDILYRMDLGRLGERLDLPGLLLDP